MAEIVHIINEGAFNRAEAAALLREAQAEDRPAFKTEKPMCRSKDFLELEFKHNFIIPTSIRWRKVEVTFTYRIDPYPFGIGVQRFLEAIPIFKQND